MKVNFLNPYPISYRNETTNKTASRRDMYSMIAEGAAIISCVSPINYSQKFIKKELPKNSKIGSGFLAAGVLGMTIDACYKLFNNDLFENQNKDTKINIKRVGLIGEIAAVIGFIFAHHNLFNYFEKGTKSEKFKKIIFALSILGVFTDAVFKIIEDEEIWNKK